LHAKQVSRTGIEYGNRYFTEGVAMGWFGNLFGRKRVAEDLSEDLTENDMRVAPVDNPLDVREDGSIRPGDPAYDYMMEVMRSGKASVANQRDDGTWDTKSL
jgi:hypothetical protein